MVSRSTNYFQASIRVIDKLSFSTREKEKEEEEAMEGRRVWQVSWPFLAKQVKSVKYHCAAVNL